MAEVPRPELPKAGQREVVDLLGQESSDQGVLPKNKLFLENAVKVNRRRPTAAEERAHEVQLAAAAELAAEEALKTKTAKTGLV